MKEMRNSFKIAFSMYSRIPVSKTEWTKEGMAYALLFFPWIGVVIGSLFVGIFYLQNYCVTHHILIPNVAFAVLYVLIPILITGGIHMDGYLDVKDAMSSWQTKERRLEILKDPHVGAFAIIWCGVYFLSVLGIYSCISEKSIFVIALGFCLSRTLSGGSVVCFLHAKKEGMAATFAQGAAKKKVRGVLCFYVVVLGVLMIGLGGMIGATSLCMGGISFLYYRRMSYQYFGGITGDLAGYFLQICELWIAAGAVISEIILRSVA